MIKALLMCLLPIIGLAQSPAPQAVAPTSRWGYGLGAGNGLELHIAHVSPHLMVLARARGKWWRADATEAGGLFGDPDNRSSQFEAGLLLGYPVAVGPVLLYGATGLAYVSGREAGAYRYTIRTSGLLSDPKNFYAHREYQALGLPLELGLLSPPLGLDEVRLGITGQVNLNPQQSVFCLLATIWFGGIKPLSPKK